MSVFLIIFRHELLLSFRRLSRVLASFLFFIIFISIFFLLDQNKTMETNLAIWISLLSCVIFSSSEFLKQDFEDGTVEQLLNSCENFEIVVLAKIIANWFVSCLPIVILSSLIKQNYEFLSIILVGSIIINFICCFCGSLSTLGNSAPMIAIIALPLIIPTLLIAQIGVIGSYEENLKILLGLFLFIGSITTIAVVKIVKIAAE